MELLQLDCGGHFCFVYIKTRPTVTRMSFKFFLLFFFDRHCGHRGESVRLDPAGGISGISLPPLPAPEPSRTCPMSPMLKGTPLIDIFPPLSSSCFTYAVGAGQREGPGGHEISIARTRINGTLCVCAKDEALAICRVIFRDQVEINARHQDKRRSGAMRAAHINKVVSR